MENKQQEGTAVCVVAPHAAIKARPAAQHTEVLVAMSLQAQKEGQHKTVYLPSGTQYAGCWHNDKRHGEAPGSSGSCRVGCSRQLNNNTGTWDALLSS
jgi:hypothetical protein